MRWVLPSVVGGGRRVLRVLATVDGRSERTRSLAHGLELVPDLDAVVAGSDVVVSVVPPGAARGHPHVDPRRGSAGAG